MIRVVVTGGRDYDNQAYLYKVLDEIHLAPGIDVLAHGACPYGGADILAEDWAKDREIDYEAYPARFKTQGKPAGPRRNKRMLKEFQPDLVVAFPGGRGTNDCITKALALGIDVMDLREDPDAKKILKGKG